MDCFERIEKAIAYIEDALCEPLTLHGIADCAFLSPYHFHRVFQGVIGSGVMEYVRRRRLSEAARELRQGSKTVAEIALQYQFESQDGFARAFRRLFGVTPGSFRRNPTAIALFPAADVSSMRIMLEKGIWHMTPAIVSDKSFLLVGIETVFSEFGPYENNGIPHFWQHEFMPRVAEIRHRRMPHATVAFERDFHGVAACRGEKNGSAYAMAAAEVSSLDDIPSGMLGRVVPPAMYAVFKQETPCGLEENSRTIAFAYGQWLPTSGFALADNYSIEVYEATGVTLYIPVKGGLPGQ